MSVDTERFDQFWREQESHGSAQELGRFYALREEYRQFANRNWGRIQQIHDDNRKSRRAILAVLLLLFGLQFAEGVLVVRAAREPARRVAAVQQQRKEGVQLQCAMLNAQTIAGREVIAAPKPGRNPALSAALAQEYVRAIQRSVEKQAGAKNARSIVSRDGSINCNAFQRLVVQHLAR